MADFYAVNGGSSASGYLIANGNVYPAVSGTSTLHAIPAGDYTHGKDLALDPKQTTMSDGTGMKKFRKFHIWGTGPEGKIWDPKLKRWREGIEFHYDGGNPGTAGCIGYQDPAAKDALINDPDKSVHVEYLQSDADVRAAIEKKLGHKVDWSKVKPLKKAGGGGGTTHSKTKKGKKVVKAAKTVTAGKKQRQTAHKTAALEGGAQVAEGSPTIFVGRELHPVSGVDHMTTDGSVLGTGEESILFA